MSDIGHGPDTPDNVVATYREIAAHFALGSNTAARVKAKRQIARGRWSTEPANHPADPIRIRIPREDWESGPNSAATPPRGANAQPSDTSGNSNGTRASRRGATLAGLREQLERARARAEAAEAQVTELRRQLEVQRDAAVQAGRRADELQIQLGEAVATLDEVRAAIAGLSADVSRVMATHPPQSWLRSWLWALLGR